MSVSASSESNVYGSADWLTQLAQVNLAEQITVKHDGKMINVKKGTLVKILDHTSRSVRTMSYIYSFNACSLIHFCTGAPRRFRVDEPEC